MIEDGMDDDTVCDWVGLFRHATYRCHGARNGEQL